MLVGADSGSAMRIGDPVAVQVEQGRRPPRPRRPLARAAIRRGHGFQEAQGRAGRHRHEPPGRLPIPLAREVRGGDGADRQRGEVPSRRQGPAQGRLRRVQRRRAVAHNVHIPPYAPAARDNHDPERTASCCCTSASSSGWRPARTRRGSRWCRPACTSPTAARRSRSRSRAARTSATSARPSRSARPSARWSERSATASAGSGATSPSATSPTRTRAATCCSTTSRSGCRRASTPGWSAPTASARARCCASSPGSCAPSEGDVGARRPRAVHGAGRRRRRTSGTVRELLLSVAPARVRDAGLSACSPPSAALAAGDDDAGMRARRGDRRVVGPRRLRARGPVGRRLPADRARAGCRRRRPAGDAAVGRRAQAARARPAVRLRRARSCCSTSPTTSSTSRPSARSRRRSAASKKTDPADQPRPRAAGRRLRHDRHARGQRRVGPRRLLRDLPRGARARARSCSATRLARWKDEERRLRELMRIFKERAQYSTRLGQAGRRRRDALEALRRRRARRPRRSPTSRSRSACAAATPRAAWSRSTTSRSTGWCSRSPRRSTSASASGSSAPTARGKTHLMRLLAGEPVAHTTARVALGTRVSAGLFTQLNVRADFAGRDVLDIVHRAAGSASSRRWARWPATASPTPRAARYETLSGGQRARLEILCLELEGHNLLLLDEPTDNLDIDSSEALEARARRLRGHGRRRLPRPRVPAAARPLPAARPRRLRDRAAGPGARAGGDRRRAGRGDVNLPNWLVYDVALPLRRKLSGDIYASAERTRRFVERQKPSDPRPRSGWGRSWIGVAAGRSTPCRRRSPSWTSSTSTAAPTSRRSPPSTGRSSGRWCARRALAASCRSTRRARRRRRRGRGCDGGRAAGRGPDGGLGRRRACARGGAAGPSPG